MSKTRMADVAAKAGVSATTVSLALRRHSRIPVATQDRIIALAEAMGYCPDSRLSELMARLRLGRKSSVSEPLAFINTLEKREWLQEIETFRLFYEGAASRADDLGYKIEEFWIKERGMSGRRLSQILYTRNIRGLVVGPSMHKIHLRFKWSNFSTIVIGHTFYHPRLHSVANNQYHSMALILRQLIKLGYRRIGVTLSMEIEKLHDYNYLAAFQIIRSHHPEAFVQPHLPADPVFKLFQAWVGEQKPDVIVSLDQRPFLWLRELGWKIPEEIGFAALCYEASSAQSGINQNSLLVGARAVDQLVGLMQSNTTGVPEHANTTLVEGAWMDGNTVRKVPAKR